MLRRATVIKASVIFILLLCSACVYAENLDYVFGGSLSSVSTENAKRGQVYLDSAMNVLVVKSVHEVELESAESDFDAVENYTVVEFDKLISRSGYQEGSELRRRGAVQSVYAVVGLNHSLLGYSFTSFLYPFYPVVMVGAGYDIPGLNFSVASGVDVLALAGVAVAVPIARMWDFDNTFIENGKISGYFAAGVAVPAFADAVSSSASTSLSDVTFAMSYGVSYRHNIGHFRWEVGVFWLYKYGATIGGGGSTGSSGAGAKISPYIGFGVDI